MAGKTYLEHVKKCPRGETYLSLQVEPENPMISLRKMKSLPEATGSQAESPGKLNSTHMWDRTGQVNSICETQGKARTVLPPS
jgi:hypothetical protein